MFDAAKLVKNIEYTKFFSIKKTRRQRTLTFINRLELKWIWKERNLVDGKGIEPLLRPAMPRVLTDRRTIRFGVAAL